MPAAPPLARTKASSAIRKSENRQAHSGQGKRGGPARPADGDPNAAAAGVVEDRHHRTSVQRTPRVAVRHHHEVAVALGKRQRPRHRVRLPSTAALGQARHLGHVPVVGTAWNSQRHAAVVHDEEPVPVNGVLADNAIDHVRAPSNRPRKPARREVRVDHVAIHLACLARYAGRHQVRPRAHVEVVGRALKPDRPAGDARVAADR
mmetsp:Transcript_5593/g.14879  ORF Transcript_5593/g.14879 Transcript_5593/m.14879 type:complete len:205 (+) Transcript_5593:140-754(+)